MSIRALAADGSAHVFPDGTPDSVIDGAMAAYAKANPPMDRGAPFPSAASVAALGRPTVATDVRKSAGSGVAQGATALPFAPGDILNAWGHGIDWLGEHVLGTKMPQMNYAHENGLADSTDANNLRQRAVGNDYVPQTVPGQYARTIGQFAPAALLPGSAGVRAANVIAPALASETAGQVMKGTPYEAPARFLAGMAGGAFAPAAATRIAAKAADMVRPEPVPVTDPSIPQAAARRAVQYVDRVTKSAGADPTALASPTGKPLMAAEVIGRPAQVALGALARRSGATPDALAGNIAARQLTRPSRILGDVETATGVKPEAAAGDMNALVARQRADAGPLFDAIRANPAPVWNPELAALAKRPVIARAINQATNDLLNAGKDPSAYGFKLDPDTGLATVGSDLSKVGEAQPTAEAWDMVRQAVGKQIERHTITGKALPDSQSPGNYGVRVATQDLTKALAGDGTTPGAIPGYRQALDKAGDYLSLQDAFDKGKTLLTNSKVTEAQAADHFKGLSPAEQDAYRGGVASHYFEMAQNDRLGAKVLNSPRVKAKLQTALGKAQAQQLIDGAGQEGAMKAFERRYGPGDGSPTQEFKAAMDEQDGGNGLTSIGSDFGSRLIAGQGLNRSAAEAVMAQVKKLGAMYQTRGMPVGARDEAGRLLMMSPEDLSAHMGRVPQRPTLFAGQAPQASLPGAALAGLLAR